MAASRYQLSSREHAVLFRPGMGTINIRDSCSSYKNVQCTAAYKIQIRIHWHAHPAGSSTL